MTTLFQALTAFQPKDYNLVSARKTFNQPKNRSQQFIPVECSRVHLTPKPGIDGSDYINASWCLGKYHLKLRSLNHRGHREDLLMISLEAKQYFFS